MITNRLLHAHVFRTGGYLFRGVLSKIPNLRVLDEYAHRSVDEMRGIGSTFKLPENLPIVTFVRNPWEWYVSQWCWVTWAKPGYRCSFRSYLETIRECSTADPNIATLTHNYYTHIQAHKATHFGRFETLKEDIERILVDIMPDLVTGEQLRELMANEPIYHPAAVYPTTERMEHYSHYYGPQTKMWVERWDAGLIAQYGYGFEDK